MPTKFRQTLTQTWQSEAILSLFLALLVSIAFVLPSLGLGENNELLYSNLTSSVMLISGVAIARRRRTLFFLASSLVAVTLAVNWIAAVIKLGVWPDLLMLASILMLEYILLSEVFAPGPVTRMRIQGAIAVYLLFGIGWAQAYAIIASVVPGAFTLPARDVASPGEWFYFSYITLATVGFGDIVPAHRIARALTITEALTGQLYLAILIGRLVGMQITAEASTPDQSSR
jgi:hypothetical protein